MRCLHRPEVYERIAKKTGLDLFEAYPYMVFCDNASFRDGVVMDGDAQYDLCSFFRSELFQSRFSFSLAKGKDDEMYDYWESFFLERGLLELIVAGNGRTYPRVKGYNPYDDPSLFVAYRKKGEDSWSGRMSASLLFYGPEAEPLRTLVHGYEFREPDVLWRLQN